MSELDAPPLTPTQAEVLDQLGSTDPPEFEPSLRHELRSAMAEVLDDYEHQLGGLVDDDRPLWVSKHQLAMVHGCEARYLAPDEFQWSVPTARGTVVHKALELLWGWRGTHTPLELVEGAMNRLEADNGSIADYLGSLDEATRADLVTQSNTHVAAFTDTFPPIKGEWLPVAESKVKAEFAGGRIVLGGKVDLTLGKARGNQARKVLIDLKTGGSRRQHVDDLRFYALVETLRNGVPPRLLANFHTDSGTVEAEPVTTDLLWSASRRVVDAIEKMVHISKPDHEPRRSPGPNCRWCPIAHDCEPGQAYLSDADDQL